MLLSAGELLVREKMGRLLSLIISDKLNAEHLLHVPFHAGFASLCIIEQV